MSVTYSYQRYSGNGTTATFSIAPIGGQPLRRTHVLAFVNGVQKSGEGVHFIVSDDLNSLTFVPGHVPPAGTNNVVIMRLTPVEAAIRVVDFSPGSMLTAKDLDDAILNALYATQEVADRNALKYDPVANSANGGGVSITNVSLDFGLIA